LGSGNSVNYLKTNKLLGQTFACFLHQLNTLIGEICTYALMKKVITKASRIVTFINSSHFWSGQLKTEAKSLNITQTLKKEFETRFYALLLQGQSVIGNQYNVSCISIDGKLMVFIEYPCHTFVFGQMLKKRRMVCHLWHQRSSE
jgi:hypothetical protein